MREQLALFRQNMHLVAGRFVPRPRRPLTAKPTPFAPHILVGRANHAIDVNALDGGEARLQRWLESHGATVTNPVPGEAWHMVISGRDLARLYHKFKSRPKLKVTIARPATKMSKAGVEFLVREEGLVPHAYNDSEGHATFGVGHLIHLGPVTEADRREWGTPTNPKTRAFALRVFRRDLKSYEATVREAVRVPLQAHEFDALVSLCFNIGRAGFRESTVVKRLNAGRRRAAADAFLMWDKPAVLKPRRERERNLFLGR